MKRVEFSKKTKLEIFRRAGGPGALVCEGCGLPLNGKPFEIDHTIECWEQLDMQAGGHIVLTADDGKLLGKNCCHLIKSNKKKGEKAHGDRIIAKAARAQRRKSRPMLGSRDSPWKAKVGGGWERR